MMNRRLFLSVAAASSAGLALSRADFPSDRKFRIAVIGHTGRGNYGHGEDAVWLKIPEAEVVGFADADTNGLAAEQKKLKLDKGYADYRQMLSAVKPDIVTIAPRFVDEHREMTLSKRPSHGSRSALRESASPSRSQISGQRWPGTCWRSGISWRRSAKTARLFATPAPGLRPSR
jgi:hypothetical protein